MRRVAQCGCGAVDAGPLRLACMNDDKAVFECLWCLLMADGIARCGYEFK